jgi:ligand-binding sensor domain-containing protein
MRYFKLYLLFLLTFSFGKLFSQAYNFKNYTVEHGLPYIIIQDIFQDDKGYLWTGGYGGLSRFDGNKFVNYSPRNGLVHYSVQSIAQDSAGNLIVGTIEGLSVFDGKNFTNYTREKGLVNEHVNTLAKQRNRMVIGTESGLFYLTDKKISTEKNLQNENIKKIKTTEKEILGVTPKKVFSIQEKSFSVLFSFLPNSDTLITCFEYDTENNFWIGTNKGLFKLNSGKKPELIVAREEITCLYTDKSNSVWIGTREKLLNYTGSIKEYSLSKEYNANDILSISSDYEQNIWIGTHSGLFKFRSEGFVCFGLEDGIRSTMIYPIIKDKKNNIWFGTDRGGLYNFDGKTFINYTTENGLAGNTVRGLVFDTTGNLWVATEKGLCIKRGNTFSPVNPLQNTFIQSIYLDKQNRLWLGLTDGVAYIENIYSGNISVKYIKLPTHIQADHLITSFCGDAKGNVWIASFIGGLYLYNGKDIKNVTNSYHLQTHSVSDVVISKNNLLYVGTLDGVYIIKPESKTCEKIREEDGLNSNLVYSLLLTDNEKNLWVGTNQGANKIDLESYFIKHVNNIISFGKTEGFKGVECNTGGLCMDTTGTLWFGTVNGIVRHSPVKYLANEKEPRLSLTNIKLFYDDTALQQQSILPNSLNNITFSYTGICLTNPEKVRYVHKLEGFEKNWSPESNQGLVTYSNLPPGKYTLRVRCCNDQGIWTSTPLSFTFTVTPPIWQRWWFILSELLFIALIIIVIFRFRLNQFRKEQERETRTLIEISKNELKALRAQMNPHFLFNSLNSIQQFILTHKEEEAVFYLNRFARLMRMILNNSEKSAVTLNEEIDALKIYIDLEKMRFSNKFDYEITVAQNIDADYEQIPTMLLQPFVENAILHGLTPGEKHGLLKINFFVENNFIHAIIEDNGIGRRKSGEINKDSHRSHVSMGMKITQDRLKLMGNIQQTTFNARILDLTDSAGNAAGTRVEITWPVL